MAESFGTKIVRFGLLDEHSPIGAYVNLDDRKYLRRFGYSGPYVPNPMAGFQSWSGNEGFGDPDPDGTTQTGSTDIWGWISQNLILVLPAVFLIGFLFSKQRE